MLSPTGVAGVNAESDRGRAGATSQSIAGCCLQPSSSMSDNSSIISWVFRASASVSTGPGDSWAFAPGPFRTICTLTSPAWKLLTSSERSASGGRVRLRAIRGTEFGAT